MYVISFMYTVCSEVKGEDSMISQNSPYIQNNLRTIALNSDTHRAMEMIFSSLWDIQVSQH